MDIFMKKILIVSTVLLTFAGFFPGNGHAKTISLSGEFGSGNMACLSALVGFNSRLSAGITAGFDFSGKDTIGVSSYSSWLIGGYAVGTYRLFTSGSMEVTGRLRAGLDVLFVDKYNASGFELSPDILLGYKGLYAAFSGGLLFLENGVHFLPSLGIGYRFTFNLKSTKVPSKAVQDE
jgi:hypothetical protein